MSHSQFHCILLYLDMHGLIFETSIWLLAESTRFYFHISWIEKQSGNQTRAQKWKERRIFLFLF